MKREQDRRGTTDRDRCWDEHDGLTPVVCRERVQSVREEIGWGGHGPSRKAALLGAADSRPATGFCADAQRPDG